MLIHPGNYVDTNGRCYHPYLSYWQDNIRSSTLTIACNLLSEAFSKEPPVYAKPSAPEPPQLPSQIGPAPAYQRQSNAGIASQPSSSPNSPPPRPPLPPELQNRHLSSPLSENHHSSFPEISPGSSYRNSPLPVYSQGIQGIARATPQPPPPVPQNSNPYLSQRPPASPIFQKSYQPSVSYSRGQATYSPGREQPPPQLQVRSRTLDLMDRNDDEIAASSSPTGTQPSTPPQRPPNPEKINAIQRLQQELDSVIKTQIEPQIHSRDTLLNHIGETIFWMEKAAAHEMSELERLSVFCDDNESMLKAKIEKAKAVIADAKSRDTPNIDEAVCAETVVYDQLYDLVAEDHAIDDTIYVLRKALDDDRIKLETFLKHTRTLAREQFLKRALVNKIAGLTGLA